MVILKMFWSNSVLEYSHFDVFLSLITKLLNVWERSYNLTKTNLNKRATANFGSYNRNINVPQKHLQIFNFQRRYKDTCSLYWSFCSSLFLFDSSVKYFPTLKVVYILIIWKHQTMVRNIYISPEHCKKKGEWWLPMTQPTFLFFKME